MNIENKFVINDYYDYESLTRSINNLIEKYSFVDLGTIGNSILGHDIPRITIGKGNKSVIYIAGHHGMEWITSAILIKFLYDYCEEYKNDSLFGGISSRVIFETRKIHIIPMLNPDGIDYSIHGVSSNNILKDRLVKMNNNSLDFSSWQANARGVDLNHNYAVGFKEYKSIEKELNIINGANSKYSGEHPESEPETKALCNFVRYEMPELALSLHSQGEEIYYTCGEHSAHNSLPIAKTIARLTGYEISLPSGTAQYGGFTEWFIEEFNKPSFTIECGKGKNPLPITKLDEIYSRLKRALFTIPILI